MVQSLQCMYMHRILYVLSPTLALVIVYLGMIYYRVYSVHFICEICTAYHASCSNEYLHEAGQMLVTLCVSPHYFFS